MPLTFKELKEFTDQQLATLKKEYEPMRGKTISIDNAKKLSNMLDKLTKDMLKKLANANIPFVSTSASSKLVTKHGMKPGDIKETIDLEEADELQQEACWTGYKQVGFKKSSRTGKRVPNCVPESVAREMQESSASSRLAKKLGDMETQKSFATGKSKIPDYSQRPRNKPYDLSKKEVKEEEVQEAMSSRKLDNLFIQKGRMQMAKDKQGEKLTDIEIDKEMKRLGIQQPLAASVSEAKLPVGASLRGQHIALKMKKSPTMKDFAPKVAKMARVTLGDLEDILPDYISGADISKLFNETPMMSMNKQSPEYKQGQQAAKQGKKYIDNPHSDAQKKLNWSGGHNAYRLMNMSEERTYTVVHVKHGKEVVKANGTYDAAKKYAQMKGLKDTSGVDAHLMEAVYHGPGIHSFGNKNSPEYKEGEKAAKQGKKYKDNPYQTSNQSRDVEKRLNWAGGHNNITKNESMSVNEASDANSPEYKEGEKAAKQGKSYSDNPYMKSNSFSAVDKRLNWAGGLENAYGRGKGHVFFNIKKESMSVNEGMFKKILQTIHDKLEKEGGAAGYDDLKQAVQKEFGLDITKDTLKNMPGVRQHRDGDYILEADLTKRQVNMVHKKADDMPKKDFIKRYGKDGDSVRFATATNMVKKKLGIEKFVPQQQRGDTMNEATYKDKFKAAMKDFGINSLDDLKSDADKKKFFKHVDGMHTAKNEELTPAQKKLPAGLQKAIAKKQGDKKEDIKEYGSMNAQYEMMKKEMMKKMEMMKAETDPKKMEMMKKEMMKEMDDMPEMMKKEMMKKMEMAMKEGFASDAQRKAAFASGYKEKGKKKKEEVEVEEEEVKEMMSAKEMMKMNAMKMPIKSSYMKSKKEMKTGDDDMTPDALKLNAMVKDPHKSKEDKPMKDMNAMYMKSDVRADVKNNGGADMAKVKDAPKMQTAMKKINATYGESNIISASTRTFNKRNEDMKYLKTKPGSIEEAYLLARGIEKKSLTEAKYVIGMQDASYFKGNEMMSAMKAGNVDKLDMHAGDGTITFTANNPGEVQRNAEKAIKDYINKETRNDRNALFAFNDLELEEVDGDGPTRQQEQSIKRVLDKYSNKAMFNTPSGKASGPLQKFADDESLEDMAISGVM